MRILFTVLERRRPISALVFKIEIDKMKCELQIFESLYFFSRTFSQLVYSVKINSSNVLTIKGYHETVNKLVSKSQKD